MVCPAADQCTATSSCSTPNTPTTGTCVAGAGLTCDDGNACTDDCCDPASGCAHTATTGGTCGDGSACTTGDVCNNGTCTGTPVQCSDNNACNGVETCDPASGCVAGTTPNCDDNDECTTDTCDLVLGCQNGSDPASFALCRLNILADAIQGTPAQELGGVKKKKKFMLEATTSLKALQKALAASPRQKAQNLRKAQRRLSRTQRRTAEDGRPRTRSQDALGNQLLDLVAKAALALQAVGK